MSVTSLVLTTGVLYVVGAALIAFGLYVVVRRGVRDGMLDARALDREETAAWRARQASRPGGEAGPDGVASPPPPQPGREPGSTDR